MAQQSYKKFVASAATATLVASALVPVASANVTTSAFTDVPASYKDAVDFVVTNNIASGKTETQFGISQQILRGDAAIMIAAAAGLNDKDAPATKFSDVPTRGALAVNSLKAAGVISGKSDTKFGFNDNITRGEAALMLQKAFDLKAGDKKNDFTDVSSRYDDAVDALVANNVTNGINKTQFGTSNNIKRGDFAKFLFALEGKIVKLQVESLKANSTTSFDVMLKEALPADADLKELLKVKVVLKDGTIVTPEATDVKVSTDRKTITVEHKNNDLDGLAGTLTVNGKNLEFNYVKEEEGSLKVESVKAINLTDVTVGIEAPTTDMVDAVVVVKDAAGKVVPTKPVTIKAGATEATFSFVNPITVSPTSQWTVNGVAYAPAKLEIVDVDSVTPNGKYLEVLFNKPLTSLEASEISIRNSNTLVRVGVEKVKLASDGMSAQVTLLGSEDAAAIIQRLTSYDFTLTQNGTVTSKQFTLPGYITEKSVTAVDAKERTITIGNTTLKVPTTMAFDFEEALGQEVAVWFDKNNNLTKFNIVDNAVKYDAVKFEVRNGVTYAKLATENKEYRLANDAALWVKSATGVTQTGIANNDAYASAKLVFNAQGQVQNIVAVQAFADALFVQSVEGNIVKANETEYNLKDYTVVKDGKTIALSDLKAGDVVFYNNAAKFAEVYTAQVSGKVEAVYQDEFKVNGKTYDYNGFFLAGGDYDGLDADAVEALKAADKPVTIYFNRAGDVVLVTGEVGEVISSTTTSFLTKTAVPYKDKAKDYILLETVNAAGEKVEENVKVEGLTSITANGILYKVGQDAYTLATAPTPPTKADPIVGFNLGAGNVLEYSVKSAPTTWIPVPDASTSLTVDATDFAAEKMFVLTKDAAGNVIGLNQQTVANPDVDNVLVSAKTIDGRQVKSSTPVFIVDRTSGIKVSTKTWGQLDKGIVELNNLKVYGTAKDVSYLVINETDIVQPNKAVTSEVVVEEINYNVKGELANLKVLQNGVSKTIEIDSSLAETTTFVVGQIVSIDVLESNGKLKAISAVTPDIVAGTINVADTGSVNTSNGTVKVNGVTYTKAASGVQIYEEVEVSGKKVVVARDFNYLSTLKADNELNVSFLNGNSKYFDTIVITKNKDVAGPGTPGTPGTGNPSSQYLSVADVTEGATTTLTLTATGTIFTPNAEDFIDVSGLPTGYTVGTVTRVSNTQVTIAITGSADFDADVASTVTVYNGGLNGVTTNQSTTAKFIAAVETLSASVSTNTFTVTNNFGHTHAIGDVDLDTATPGMNTTVVVNGITYTVSMGAAGVYTVNATAGAATATAPATTKKFEVKVANAPTLELNLDIPAVTALDAFGTVTPTITK